MTFIARAASLVMVASLLAGSAPAMPAGAGLDAAIGHGGGCRKSSPPGQCCHMDKRAGAVHCH